MPDNPEFPRDAIGSALSDFLDSRQFRVIPDNQAALTAFSLNFQCSSDHLADFDS
jgi:hypothetical protein